MIERKPPITGVRGAFQGYNPKGLRNAKCEHMAK